MTRAQIQEKHGKLPEPLIIAIIMLGEKVVMLLIEMAKNAREKRIAKRKAKENGNPT